MDTKAKKTRRKIPWLKMIAQNAQGMSSIVKLQAIVNNFEKRNFFAAFISETWREGDEKLKQNHTYIYGSAEATKSCNRGAKGVAIMLSTQAEEARVEPYSELIVFFIYLIKCGRHSTRHKRSFDVVVIVARKGVFQIQLVVTGRTCDTVNRTSV